MKKTWHKPGLLFIQVDHRLATCFAAGRRFASLAAGRFAMTAILSLSLGGRSGFAVGGLVFPGTRGWLATHSCRFGRITCAR